MLVQDIIDALGEGELSKSGMFMDGSLSAKNEARVVRYINQGLRELHSRFNLKEKEVNLELFSHITEYEITSKFAKTNSGSNELYKYVDDSQWQPFEDDIAQITAVYDEVGNELTLNSDNAELTAVVIDYRTIQIPNPIETNILSVIYKAHHAKVEAVTDEIDMPPTLQPLLLAFVAQRYFSGSSDPEGVNIYISMVQRYEALVKQYKDQGLVNNLDGTENEKLEMRGFI